MKARSVRCVALAASLALSGCSGSEPATPAVTVFAAASLQGAFTEIAAGLPDVAVRFSFDGSAALVDQLAGGARADVLATADRATMTRAQDKQLVTGTPEVFARNHLTLIVPRGNPAEVTGLNASLGGAKLVVCAASVPCGAATRALATRLGVTLRPVSEETKVSDVRGKVESGEADAGIVYTTDARAAGDRVEAIAVSGAEAIVNAYPIALVTDAPHAAQARAFIGAVTSPAGKAVLARYGFTVG